MDTLELEIRMGRGRHADPYRHRRPDRADLIAALLGVLAAVVTVAAVAVGLIRST
jgi:hypothetical protein